MIDDAAWGHMVGHVLDHQSSACTAGSSGPGPATEKPRDTLRRRATSQRVVVTTTMSRGVATLEVDDDERDHDAEEHSDHHAGGQDHPGPLGHSDATTFVIAWQPHAHCISASSS
ncbi:hypothetical protein [Isoptericola sp. NPDC058082]|uniref:hypothetical protein n=1 Tax=Isoptericola sp. NPDC058082 TaxID=3346331 RepID=UPI0036E1F254